MMETMVSSRGREVIIAGDRPTVLIGERINPAGKKRLAEALKRGDLDIVRSEALAQAQAGADILDVCVSTFGVDEVELLPRAVRAVMETVDIPLCIDTTNPAALEAALKVYKGKALVNSVSGEEPSLARVLPLVKRYGAAVVGLVQDDEGIPKNAERRVAVARKIIERAEKRGIAREDIVIDCLASSVGADTESGAAVVEAIGRIRAELGVNITLGASNVSFGLPQREVINSSFVAIAIAAGATCLIVDVARVRPVVLAADLVLARDRRARRYIEAYRERQGR
jgi:5-methyltetrahydrofolate--homocysteine methyltransferase